MSRILITGATGFIGRHLVERLRAQHELYCIARAIPPAVSDRVFWVKDDLAVGLNEGQLPSRLDAVVHLAQSSRYRDFPEGARDVFAINVRSTFDLLEYARRSGARSF